MQRQGVQAADDDAGAEARGAGAQADPREALQQHLQRDAGLEARERRAEAMVDAAPEREVGVRVAPDIEPVRIVERVRIPVARAEQDEDVVAPAQRESVHLAIGKHAHLRGLYRSRLGARAAAMA